MAILASKWALRQILLEIEDIQYVKRHETITTNVYAPNNRTPKYI